jgi:chromosome segregation ATPase
VQLEEKDEYIMRLMEDGALKQGQIEELEDKLAEWEEYLRKQHERLEMMQEEIEEFSRKDRSQKETLEDLVKKNLELEMQLNMRNFELQTLKARK